MAGLDDRRTAGRRLVAEVAVGAGAAVPGVAGRQRDDAGGHRGRGRHVELDRPQPIDILNEVGGRREQVAAIAEGPAAAAFNDLERKVLAFTDELTSNVRVSDATFDALAALLPHRQLVELTLATAFYGLAARVMEVFEVELEPGAGTYTLEALQPKKD